MMSSFRYTRVRSVADGMSGFVWRVKPGLLFNSKVRLWLEVRGSMLSIFRDEVRWSTKMNGFNFHWSTRLLYKMDL